VPVFSDSLKSGDFLTRSSILGLDCVVSYVIHKTFTILFAPESIPRAGPVQGKLPILRR
jgi:hypothetical protein